jgi:carboxylesterase type B
MVLYGQSAGAESVMMYGYAHPHDPIVKGLIASSGSIKPTYPTTNSSFHDLAQVVGCANLTSTEELACMQEVDALVLKKYIERIQPETHVFQGQFRPIADGVTVFANNTERLEKGLVAKVVRLVTSFSLSMHATLEPLDDREADTATVEAHDHRLHFQRGRGLPAL